MRVAALRFLRGAGVAALAVAWAVAAHLTSTEGAPSTWGAALALAPLAAALVLALWRLPNRWLAALIAIASMLLLVECWPLLESRVALLFLVQHVGVNGLLAAIFGRTLTGQGEPLVTQMARRVQAGELSTRQVLYTRKVTIAWCAFFVATAAVSVLLFVLAPAAAWSAFANLLTAPLVALMFVGEYLARRRALPASERPGFAAALRAWKAHRPEVVSRGTDFPESGQTAQGGADGQTANASVEPAPPTRPSR